MQVNDSPFPELLPSLFCRLRQRGRGKCEGTSRSARGLASPLTVHPRMMPGGIGRGMPGGKVVSATRTFGMRTARRILGCTQKDEVKQYKRKPIYKVSMEEASCGAVSPVVHKPKTETIFASRVRHGAQRLATPATALQFDPEDSFAHVSLRHTDRSALNTEKSAT